MHFQLLTNPLDPRLDDYRNISDAELLRERSLFIAEGRLVVRRLLTESTLTARSVVVTEAAHAALADVFDAHADVPVYQVTQEVINRITGFNIHRGCLAVGERAEPRGWDDLTRGARLVVFLERVANADNVGAVFRSAAAFGADAVLLDEVTTDPLYRKAIRTSMGASLMMPFARVGAIPDVLDALRDEGVATVALTPSDSAQPLSQVAQETGVRPVAIVLGHEGDGLTAESLDACEYHARIPISSGIDSLNVSAAAAIALYELNRGL